MKSTVLNELYPNSMKNKLIVIDKNDNIVGYEEKEKCHDNEGIPHSAFSVFIFNNKGQLLIQQRSKFKRLWPLHWSNSCCSHPRPREELKKAAQRRIAEELGIFCELKYLYKFRYTASYKNIGSENEICAVLIGKSDDGVILNPAEIQDFKWVDIGELRKDVERNPEKYTPWFKMEIKELLSLYTEEIINL